MIDGILTIPQAIVYGILYLLFGAFPIVYRGRGWNEGVAGLPFIGVAIGMFFAIVFVFTYDNVRYQKCIKNSPNGVATPEDRLPAAMVGGLVLPIGLFWFSWTNSPDLPWPASVAAAIPFGMGMVLVFLSLFSYLIDAYTVFAASVLAGSGVLRSLFGAAFPLFTFQMYRNLGKYKNAFGWNHKSDKVRHPLGINDPGLLVHCMRHIPLYPVQVRRSNPQALQVRRRS